MKILRNIRKQLASENKKVAYLRYAMGEIILVVIGILIALQVNNWNEHRKNQQVELSYAKSLLTDLKGDLIDINVTIDRNKRRLSGLDSLLTYAHKNLLIPDNNDRVYVLFYRYLTSTDTFDNNTTTLSQLTNSGGLNFMRKQVADSIASFQESLTVVNGQKDVYTTIAYKALYQGLAFADFTEINDTTYFNHGIYTGKHFPPVSKDPQLRKVFFNYAQLMYGVTHNYVFNFLEPHKKKTQNFIHFLKKTYRIQ